MRRHAAGILPVARSTGRVFVARRSLGVSEPSTWSFPGGMAEIDRYTGFPESPSDTAIREFIEETFVRPLEIIPLGVVTNEDGTDFHVFLGVFDDEFIPRLNWENDRWMWLDLGDLLMLRQKHHGLDKLLRDPHVFDLLRSFS